MRVSDILRRRPVVRWLLLIALVAVACGSRGYREVVIVTASGAQYHALLEGGSPPAQPEAIVPDRILVFRTTARIALGERTAVGLGGNVYRVNGRMELELVERCDTSLSDAALAKRYAR